MLAILVLIIVGAFFLWFSVVKIHSTQGNLCGDDPDYDDVFNGQNTLEPGPGKTEAECATMDDYFSEATDFESSYIE